MAGHSQFKNIMHRKGKQDKERSKLFAKLSPERPSGGQVRPARPGPQSAPALRHHRGQRDPMPKDNIATAPSRRRSAVRARTDEVR